MSSEGSNRRYAWGWTVAAVVAVSGAVMWQGQNRAGARQSAAPDTSTPKGPHVVASSPIEAGRYIVKVGGCNDCHTPGFAMTNGQVPESEWLVGEKMGFRGPWGTTYASNLRLFVRDLSENDFVLIVRNRNTRPPMPWPSLHAMSDQDLRSLYAYLKSLETKGERAPDYVPPTEEPVTPYLSWQPIFPKSARPADGK
ncbi:hypothetical protein [Humisphaera borealis]|uniref:Cytochrome C n=1 Tax=Humisphaera borealis TaxID=2807512 RepID=A0A7M2X0S1_9BACT|nr:hypothetical protein [Humisphaera borealis]QOV91285.1 cytochrome C [Humisphaera borealis]